MALSPVHAAHLLYLAAGASNTPTASVACVCFRVPVCCAFVRPAVVSEQPAASHIVCRVWQVLQKRTAQQKIDVGLLITLCPCARRTLMLCFFLFIAALL